MTADDVQKLTTCHRQVRANAKLTNELDDVGSLNWLLDVAIVTGQKGVVPISLRPDLEGRKGARPT